MKSESCSIVSNSLWPHGLYSPWNSPSQNTGVGSLSLLQGIFPTQGSNPGLPHYGQVLYQLSHLHKETILNTLPGLSGKNMRRKRMKCLRATTSNELMFWSNKTSLTFFFFFRNTEPPFLLTASCVEWDPESLLPVSPPHPPCSPSLCQVTYPNKEWRLSKRTSSQIWNLDSGFRLKINEWSSKIETLGTKETSYCMMDTFGCTFSVKRFVQPPQV